VKGRGRSKKTWGECVGQDLKFLGLKKERAQDTAEWRGLIGGAGGNACIRILSKFKLISP